MNSIVRVITVFLKNGSEDLQDEIILKDFSLEEVQKLFQVESDNPMYDCWEIREKEAKYFESKFGIDFDLNKYVYFVEAYMEEK